MTEENQNSPPIPDPEELKKRLQAHLEELKEEEELHKPLPVEDIRNKQLKAEADADVAFATGKALEELEKIRQLFLKLQEDIQGMVLAQQLDPGLDMMAQHMKSLHELLADDIDTSKLTTQGKAEYLRAQKIRAAILASINNHYKK